MASNGVFNKFQEILFLLRTQFQEMTHRACTCFNVVMLACLDAWGTMEQWMRHRDSGVTATASWLCAFGKITEASGATCERQTRKTTLLFLIGLQRFLVDFLKIWEIFMVFVMIGGSTGIYWMKVWDVLSFDKQDRPPTWRCFLGDTTSQCPLDIAGVRCSPGTQSAWSMNTTSVQYPCILAIPAMRFSCKLRWNCILFLQLY